MPFRIDAQTHFCLTHRGCSVSKVQLSMCFCFFHRLVNRFKCLTISSLCKNSRTDVMSPVARTKSACSCEMFSFEFFLCFKLNICHVPFIRLACLIVFLSHVTVDGRHHSSHLCQFLTHLPVGW